jgi:hypothetical protein
MNQINFFLSQLDRKINSLRSNGFKEYLNTWERYTVNGDENLNHLVFTCTEGYYSGWVADIYYNKSDGRCWLEYSLQTATSNS